MAIRVHRRRWCASAVGLWLGAVLSSVALACASLGAAPSPERALSSAGARPPDGAALATPAGTVTALAPTPSPGPTVAELPPDAQFGVPLGRIGCHARPQVQAEIVSFAQAGRVVPLAAVVIERTEVWYREATGGCWLRAVPGPMLLAFSTRRRAECFALPAGPGAAAVTDCVVIDGASDLAAAPRGDIAASAPPGSRCAAYRVVNESGRLRVQNLPAARADARGLVAWTWQRGDETGVESSTVTVMCIPGGAASVTLAPR